MLFRGLRGLLLVCLALCGGSVWGQTDSIPAGEYVVAGIAVEGIQRAERGSILNASGLRIGDKINYPGKDLGDALRRLWKQGIYDDVQLEAENVVGNRIFLVIRVSERPRISKYTFLGISKGNADDLREKINFIRGQRFTETKKRNAERVIKNFYYEKGYFNTEVKVTTKDDPDMPGGVIVIMDVNKNKRVKINKIYLEGNKITPDRKIKKQMKKTKERRFYKVFWRSKFIPALYQEDKEKVIAYLNTKGFRDAQITWDTIYKQGGRFIDLKINIYEGQVYHFRDIAFKGNFKYSAGFLDTLLGIRKGDVYNTELLERRLNMDPNGTDIGSLYLDDGHLFFRAEPVEIAVFKDSIDLEIRIYEGPQATVDKIIIEGNTKTSDYVIQREIRTLPGTKFSRAEVIRTQREILNLGFFNQENMQITPLPNPEKGTVDIKYVVEEKPSDQLFFQAGWGGRQLDQYGNQVGTGLVATVGLQFNNFSTKRIFDRSAWKPLPSGDGQKLSLRLQLSGRNYQNYGISFQEPWFGGKKPNSFGVSVNYTVQRQSSTDFLFRTISTSLDFGKRLKWPDDFFRSFSTISYRHYNVRNVGSLFAGIDNGNVNILSFKQTFNRTSIDVPIYPTRGSVLDFSVELTPPWSYLIPKDYKNLPSNEKYKMLEFHKWKFSTETYTRITNNKLPMVLFARMQTGFLGQYNPEVGVSPFERFWLGGDGLFGFNLDGREVLALRGHPSPTLQEYEGRGANGGGGTIFNKFTIEVRQPFTLSPQATVWMHGFFEAGNAWNDIKDYNPFDLRRSVGTGVRIFLPIFGLLGVDWGYTFDQLPSTDKPWQFHFMIGQQF